MHSIYEMVQTDSFCVLLAVLFLCCGFLEAVGCKEKGEGCWRDDQAHVGTCVMGTCRPHSHNSVITGFTSQCQPPYLYNHAVITGFTP